MKFTIHHLLGIDSAEVDVGPGEIVEVVGPNASGKTSFAVVVQALAGRNVNPLGLSIGDARKTYLHKGDEDGFGRLTYPTIGPLDADIEWLPRNATMTALTSGESAEPLSRPEAVGLVDFVGRQSEKARAAMLQPILLPPPEDVLDTLKELLKGQMSAQDLAGVLKSIVDRGWDKTEAVYSDRSRIAQRSWGDVTGRRYGVSVAADWLPDGWLADYDGKTVLETEGDVATARDALALLHKAQAVAEVKEEIISEQQQSEADKAKAALPVMRRKVAEADDEWSRVRKLSLKAIELDSDQRTLIRKMDAKLKALHPRSAPENSLCPECDTPLMILKGKIVRCDLTAFELDEDARAAEMVTLKESIEVAQGKLGLLHADKVSLEETDRVANEESRALKRSLGELSRQADVTGEVIGVVEQMRRDEAKHLREEENTRSLAEAEQELHDREAVVKVVADAIKAGDLHDTITRYKIISGAIGVRGVRNKMLTAGLGKLNAGLAHLSKASGWPMVEVDAKGIVMIAGTHMILPSMMCSESEKWRAQAMIQLTVGVMSDSRVVMIDRADMLDQDGWGGLVKAVGVATAGKPMSVLLCSTGELDEAAPWRQVAIDKGKT